MGDDRFCYLHVSEVLSSQLLLDEEDAKLGWDLPDDDILVPTHLLPPYQDEDDETILPSSAHPSYPYGNPYNLSQPRASTSSSDRRRSHVVSISRGGGGHLASRSLGPLLPGSKSTSGGSGSLATTLPNLELKALFATTTLGDARDREWGEMGLASLLGGEGEGWGDDPEAVLRNAGIATAGAGGAGATDGVDSGEAQGQNAGDHPETEEEEDG